MVVGSQLVKQPDFSPLDSSEKWFAMSHPTTTSVLSQLSDEVRDALTDWLADGDLNWQPGQIERQLDSLPPELKLFRHVAIAELVKIDIVKMWRREMETLLESYLERFPELGTADTVTPDLIVAELEARKLQKTRYSAGLPRVNDGALLFLQTMLAKVDPGFETAV